MHVNGEDVKVVQELLRHRSAKITTDIYAKAVTKAKRTAQNRVVDIFVLRRAAWKTCVPKVSPVQNW
jgi:integrase